VIDVLLLGTGSLARQFAYALALQSETSVSVCIGSRIRSDAIEVAHLCKMRSLIAGTKSMFQGCFFSWDNLSEAARIIHEFQPRVIFHASSLQSPWTMDPTTNPWSEVVRRVGFGITLPLQASLLIYLLRAVNETTEMPIIVNACYPDWVNAAVTWLDYPVFCGIGNIGIIESAFRAECEVETGAHVRLIAHHSHLAALQASAPSQIFPRIWVDRESIDPASITFRSLREISGQELNVLTGALAADLIRRILAGKHFAAHVPGPVGLPGGYPVTIRGSEMHLDLPAEISLVDAVRWNSEAGLRDGIRVHEDGMVEFSEVASLTLRNLSADIPMKFPSQQLMEVASVMLELRSRLVGRS
jgi:hypothetical protein